MEITKAIITAGGRGTRFLPAVKAYQKEMIPVMNKPQLQWIIEEAVESGIKQIAIVNREGVDTLAKYLADDNKLWKFLQESGKTSVMDSLVELKNKVEITLFEQKESDPYGNGTPFLITKDWTEGQTVAAMWGDDLMVQVDKTKPTCLQQMSEYYEKYNPVVVTSVLEVSPLMIPKGGRFEYFSKEESPIPYHAKSVVEKPAIDKAPSLFEQASRFILAPEVFTELENRISGKGGELWLTDAINRLMEKGFLVIAPPWEGLIWAPCGDPIRWLKGNILVALHNGEYENERIELVEFMKSVVRE